MFVAALAAGLSIFGCAASGQVSESDVAKVKSDFSQDKYEEAMKKAGRGDELAKEKAAAAKRGEDSQQ